MKRIPLIMISMFLVLISVYTVSITRAGTKAVSSDIIFDHSLHVDLECIECHALAGESDKSGDKLFPEMEFCGNCHDIDEPEECGMCHRNPDEPVASPNPIRNIIFNHKKHIDQEVNCGECHSSAEKPILPGMPICMDCHDGNMADNDCALCHGNTYTLIDIHPLNWRHEHSDRASTDKQFCDGCHKRETFCIDCHRGDNTEGKIHELNYRYTHGLDAGAKINDCTACHDRQTFCNDCHIRENRMPLEHSRLNWLVEHGPAARHDVENCASCHDSADPTCARIGCHADTDGLRGTNPMIHGNIPAGKGPWHSDDGYYCFDCHTNTGTSGVGFCGYCHSFGD